MDSGGKLSDDQQLNGLTGSPPALIVFDGQLYSVYEKGGGAGNIAWTTLPLNSNADDPGNPDNQWIEIHGANSYCYYELHSAATQSQHIATSKTINVGAGATYITAVLIKNEDSIDFPTGAMLKITGPDEAAFDHDTDTDGLQIILSGNSLQGLVIEAPKAGDYQVTLSVPAGVEFHFEFVTTPSQLVADTINDVLTKGYASSSQQLQKRGLGPQVDQTVAQYLAYAAIVVLATGAGRWANEDGSEKYVYGQGRKTRRWAGSYSQQSKKRRETPRRLATQLFGKERIGEEIGDTDGRPLLLDVDQTTTKVYVILYNQTYAWIPIKHITNYYNQSTQPYSAGCPQFFGGNLETDDASLASVTAQLVLEVQQESRGTLALNNSATLEQLLVAPAAPGSKKLYVFYASPNPNNWSELGRQITRQVNSQNATVMDWSGDLSDNVLYRADRLDWLETLRVQRIERSDFVGLQTNQLLDTLISRTVDQPGARVDQFRASHTAQAFLSFFAKWLA